MPLYEYQCQECGQVFEKLDRFSEADSHPTCPTCESHNTNRMITILASVGVGGASSFNASSSSCDSSSSSFT
jgi:putative FmdB family regulatory protein